MNPSRDAASPHRSQPSNADLPSGRRRESRRVHKVAVGEAAYPVLPACSRDSNVPVPADSKPAVARQVSEITIAAGVPLPLSAKRIFTNIAGTIALATLAGALVFAFARTPKSGNGSPLSSNISSAPKALLMQASSNPTRTVRGKVTEAVAREAMRAGDTAAVAATAVTTSVHAPSGAMRTAHLTTHDLKGHATMPMKHAKFVAGAGSHKKAMTTKHAPHATHSRATSRVVAHAQAKSTRS